MKAAVGTVTIVVVAPLMEAALSLSPGKKLKE
jgi:hypothetical protein